MAEHPPVPPCRPRRGVRLLLASVVATVALTAVTTAPALAMQIGIAVTGGGAQFSLDVEPSDSIENIKAKITDAQGYPAADQTLIYNGETLNDGRTLADYNINKDAVLTLVLAGPPVPPTPPMPPTNADTDGDGLTDAQERSLGTDPARADTDGDTLVDGAEVNGIDVAAKVRLKHRAAKPIGLVRTDPLRADTDRDGLDDGSEVRGRALRSRVHTKSRTFVIGFVQTDPTRADTDRDGASDKAEITGASHRKGKTKASNPLDWDTDRGGASDGREIKNRTDPNRSGR